MPFLFNRSAILAEDALHSNSAQHWGWRVMREVVFAAAGCLAASSVCLSAYAESITRTRIKDFTAVWRVDEPTVNEPGPHPLTQIKLSPGQRVTVKAGGCVQTGGFGQTWKDYVHPRGDNSDRLYFGTMNVPTVTSGAEPIATVISRGEMLIRDVPAGFDMSKFVLSIGYVDDAGEYGNNGYDEHDNGNDDQCEGIGAAWIEITVQEVGFDPDPGVTWNESPYINLRPMDLWWQAFDDNLLALNPMWAIQKQQPGTKPDPKTLCNSFHDEDDMLNLGNPPCTSARVEVDEPNYKHPEYWAVCQFWPKSPDQGQVHGHINWSLATYTGAVNFSDLQSGHSGDGDVDLSIETPGNAGVTTGKSALDMEFKAAETIDHFTTPWWTQFRGRIQHSPEKGIAHLFDRAVAIGLLGIDNKHSAHAELHPVLGFMGRVAVQANGEHWVWFVRKTGDEGGCSQGLHPFTSADPDRMTFRLQTDAPPMQIADQDHALDSNFSGLWGNQVAAGNQVIFTIEFTSLKGIPSDVLTSASSLAWGEFFVRYANAAHLTSGSFPTGSEVLPPTHGPVAQPSHPVLSTADSKKAIHGGQTAATTKPPIARFDSRPSIGPVARPGIMLIKEEPEYLASVLEKLTANQRAVYNDWVGPRANKPQLLPHKTLQRNDAIVMQRAASIDKPDPSTVGAPPKTPNPQIVKDQDTQWEGLVRATGSEAAAIKLLPPMDPSRPSPTRVKPYEPPRIH